MMPDGVGRALADADLALRQLPPAERLGFHRARSSGASLMRCSAQPTAPRSDLTADRRTGTGSRRGRGDLSRAGDSSRSSRPGREPGTRQDSAHARRRRPSTKRGSATSRRARSRTRRRRVSRCTRQGQRMLARRWRAHIVCGRSSTTALPWITVQVGLELARAHLALARCWRGTNRAHGDRARTRAPSAAWAFWSTTLGCCETVSRRAPEPAGAWAMSMTGAELRLHSVSGHPPHVPGDRQPAVHLAQHGQERGGRHLPQARRSLA